MAVVADTSILIDHLRGVHAAHELLASERQAEGIAASVLTRTELIVGASKGEHQPIQELFDEIDWIPVLERFADEAGRLAARFNRSHQGIDLVDYVIAATAIALDAPLLTRNVRHFPMFEGLSAPY